MAKFSDLSEQDRIQYVKDGFVLILERLAKDPSKLKEYIPVVEKPKAISAAIEPVSNLMSEAEKITIIERNTQAEINAKLLSDKAEEFYKKQSETFLKVEAIVKNLQKKEGCLCGSCININITNSVIQPELEPLIDAAKKEAENKIY